MTYIAAFFSSAVVLSVLSMSNWAATISGVSCISGSTSSVSPLKTSILILHDTNLNSYILLRSDYTYYSNTSFSSSPDWSSGTSCGNMSPLNGSFHLGTQTLVSVGVLAKEVRPWDGNFFHDMVPLITSCYRTQRIPLLYCNCGVEIYIQPQKLLSDMMKWSKGGVHCSMMINLHGS